MARRCWAAVSQYCLMSACTDDPLLREVQQAIAEAYATMAESWELLERSRQQIRDFRPPSTGNESG
jgi:hypothetical protein